MIIFIMLAHLVISATVFFIALVILKGKKKWWSLVITPAVFFLPFYDAMVSNVGFEYLCATQQYHFSKDVDELTRQKHIALVDTPRNTWITHYLKHFDFVENKKADDSYEKVVLDRSVKYPRYNRGVNKVPIDRPVSRFQITQTKYEIWVPYVVKYFYQIKDLEDSKVYYEGIQYLRYKQSGWLYAKYDESGSPEKCSYIPVRKFYNAVNRLMGEK